MKKLGLTGSIATGKSTVLNYFSELGYPTFSADDAVHSLYANQAIPLIKEFYPPAIVNGIIDRAILASYLIENPELLVELENLIHPLVQQSYFEFLKNSKSAEHNLLVADIPLLFEVGSNYGFDAIAVTFCSTKEQHRRAMSRKGMSEKKLQTILMRQMEQGQKKLRADYLIDTEISLEATRKQVVQIAKDILQN